MKEMLLRDFLFDKRLVDSAEAELRRLAMNDQMKLKQE